MNFIQFIFYSLCLFGCYEAVKSYRVGVGRADCTGPPVEIVFVSFSSFFKKKKKTIFKQKQLFQKNSVKEISCTVRSMKNYNLK